MEEEKEYQFAPDYRNDLIIFGDLCDAIYKGHQIDYLRNKLILEFRPTPYTREFHQIQESEWNIETGSIVREFDLDLCIFQPHNINSMRFIILTDYKGREDTELFDKAMKNYQAHISSNKIVDRMNKGLGLSIPLASRLNIDLINKVRDLRAQNEVLKRRVSYYQMMMKQNASHPEAGRSRDLKLIQDTIAITQKIANEASK
jgi:hypothetical protein